MLLIISILGAKCPVGLRTPKPTHSSRRRQSPLQQLFPVQHSTTQYHTCELHPSFFPFSPIPPSRLALHFSPNSLLENVTKGHYTDLMVLSKD